MSAGYSGTPLPKKLGIKPETDVALIGAPADFEETLGALPEGVRLLRARRGKVDLALWFVTRRADLAKRLDAMVARSGGEIWVAWPKRSSGVRTDITEDLIREVVLPRGLVDYKVCAIDQTWSGLRITHRKGTSP